MKRALGVMVLLLASACSSADPEPSADPSPPTSSKDAPTASPTERPKRPGPRLRAAQLELSRTTSGAYDLSIWIGGADDPYISESGRFAVPQEVMEVERTVQNAGRTRGEPESFVMRIRSSPRTRFLQMDDWGPWEGCWAEFSPELMAEVGIDLSGVPNIPVPVSLVIDARLAPQQRPVAFRRGDGATVVPASSVAAPGDRVTVHTDGVTALQMLGISGRRLYELDVAVARVKVPVTLEYFEPYPDVVQHVMVDGARVADALRDADAPLDRRLLAFADAAWGSAVFSKDPFPVRFDPPPRDLLLPAGATRDRTCPANRD